MKANVPPFKYAMRNLSRAMKIWKLGLMRTCIVIFLFHVEVQNVDCLINFSLFHIHFSYRKHREAFLNKNKEYNKMLPNIFGEGCETLPASVVTAPSVIFFKIRLEKVWTEVFSHLPHWLNTQPHHHFPPLHHSLTVIISIIMPPLTVSISICFSTPCFIHVVSSGPLWPTFHRYKS